MSEDQSRVGATHLALLEESLLERTRERDDVRLKLMKADQQLAVIHLIVTESNRRQRETDEDLSINSALLETKDLELLERTTLLATAALALSNRTAQLQESNTYLVTRTSELEEANTKLNDMIRQRLQREDFVAALTHDLKNPLIGCSRILELIINGELILKQHPGVLKQILESNKTMLRMIWNLLDVYRHDSGYLVPAKECVDVTVLLQHCLGDFTFNINQKNLDLLVDIPDDLPPINTDGLLLRRVLSNLLDNGTKFAPEGGQLSVSATCDSKHLRISVQNSGPTLTARQQEHLFERFWQGRQHEIGTGLGLFLSKQIMEVLGGGIGCVSTENGGTTFTVTMPFAGTSNG